ncbi:hypothetical protein GCM10023320_49490 [Pseudonocardia adelaidensis]|uniref:CoA-binding domain-containing protein n=1 Tax=Pseudonocardia adelaidensis TaxID=648754 RepID=A0ABP9NQX0_9PSEU
MAYRVLAAGLSPDPVTIARFRSRQATALAWGLRGVAAVVRRSRPSQGGRDVFRRREGLPSVLDDVLAAGGVERFWLQFGRFDEDVARRAEAGGSRS